MISSRNSQKGNNKIISKCNCNTSLNDAHDLDDEEDEKNCRFFIYDGFFLSEQAENALILASNITTKTSSSRKSYFGKSSRKFVTSCNKNDIKKAFISTLDTIPETKLLEKPVDIRVVKIIIFFDGYRYVKEVKKISECIHYFLTTHVNFTCMKNVSQILSEAYKQINKENELSSSFSCMTIVLSNSDICIAHVGESRAIITGPDGIPIQLTEEHIDIYTRKITNCFGKSICKPDLIHFQVSKNDSNPNTDCKSSLSKNIFQRLSFSTLPKPTFLVIANAPLWESASNKKVSDYITRLLMKKAPIEEIRKGIIRKLINPRKSRCTDVDLLILTF